jgi:hypothetical protein
MADPNANILSLTLPTDLLSGSGGGGSGLNFSYNFGPNADTIAKNAYGFVAQQASNAFAFEGNSIAGTQAFVSNNAAPLVSAIKGESDAFYGSILGAFNAVTSAQQAIGQQGISAEQQVANASISASRRAQKGGSLLGGLFGGCFITTAVCRYSGRPDDCELLQTMRAWRDSWMQETAQRRALVERYYEDAPRYVMAIDQRSDARFIYAELERLIATCAHWVKLRKHRMALAYYLAAVEFARVHAEREISDGE